MTDILITGATGNVGQELTRRAVEADLPVRAGVRNLEKARMILEGSCLTLTHFDFYSPQTYRDALNGVKKVFLVAPPGDPNRVDKFVAGFIDTGIELGCEHFTFCSARAAAHIDRSLSMHKIEAHLEDAGCSYTVLRPSWFMQNFNTMLAESIRYANAIRLPCADAKVTFIDVRDIAAIALKTLTCIGHDGMTYTLSGPEALSFSDAAEKISNAIDRKVIYADIPNDVFIDEMQQHGVPEGASRFLSFLFDLLKLGTEAEVLPDTEAVLGCESISYDKYAQDYAAAWK